MARLIHSAIASLDGYITDRSGRFDWATPDEQVHSFANDLERDVGTHLYGRRMCETMLAWESPALSAGQPAYIEDFAQIWRAAEKVVYSTTLAAVSSARTRIERTFDPEVVRRLKEESQSDLTIGGPTLAAQAIGAGLVDECLLFIVPVVVGGGLPAFPGVSLTLSLLEERLFDSGTVYVRYAVTGRSPHEAGR